MTVAPMLLIDDVRYMQRVTTAPRSWRLTNLVGRSPGVLLLYRHGDLDPAAVARFVDALLANLGGDGLHLDLIQTALSRSGLRTTSMRECSGDHVQTTTELANDFSDVLYRRMAGDRLLRRVLTNLVERVLCGTTAPAPSAHLTNAEMMALRDCCSENPEAAHIADYDRYAALHAHGSICGSCAAGIHGQ